MSDSKHSPLEISVDRRGDDAIVVVNGEVDLESSVVLSGTLAELNARHVTLDLTEVAYMDSTGLRAILVAKEDVERAGGTLDVSAASKIVSRLIEISGVGELLGNGPIEPTTTP